MVVSLKLRDKAGLDAFTSRLGSGNGTKPMTQAEFMDRHAPTAEQARRVADYLTAQGFTHIEIAPNRLLVSADGTAGTVKGAFRAELHDVVASGEHVVGLHSSTGQRQGRSLQLHEALVFHLRDGKIVEAWEHYADSQTWDEFFR